MKFGTVVSGVDFAGSGLASARWVARFFRPQRMILVSVVHLPAPSRFLAGLRGDDDQILRSARLGTERRLDDFANRMEEETGVTTEYRVRVGAPAEEIDAEAEQADADLLVVGPHASRKGRWSLLGSTAVQLLHDARIPTLVGRGALHGRPGNVMGAIDDSAVAAGVPVWTRKLAADLEATATLLHVVEVPLEAHLRAIEPPRETREGGPIDEAIEGRVREWMGELASDAGFGDDVQVRVALGEPAVEILAAADRFAIDLIVMGTRAAGAVTRALMGSVADAVLRRASCPVLAVPTPEVSLDAFQPTGM